MWFCTCGRVFFFFFFDCDVLCLNLVEKEEKNEKVAQVIDDNVNEDEDWLPPPPKLSVDVQNQLGEDSTIKQIRYSQISTYLEYGIGITKLHVSNFQ